MTPIELLSQGGREPDKLIYFPADSSLSIFVPPFSARWAICILFDHPIIGFITIKRDEFPLAEISEALEPFPSDIVVDDVSRTACFGRVKLCKQ